MGRFFRLCTEPIWHGQLSVAILAQALIVVLVGELLSLLLLLLRVLLRLLFLLPCVLLALPLLLPLLLLPLLLLSLLLLPLPNRERGKSGLPLPAAILTPSPAPWTDQVTRASRQGAGPPAGGGC